MNGPNRPLAVLLLLVPSVAAAGDPTPAVGLPLAADLAIEFAAESGTWMSVDVAPDGRTILFDLLGDLYTVPIEGGDARCILPGLAFESQPRYSPDGKRIAFISDRSGGENVWVADADGAHPAPLTSTLDAKYVSPAWAPDGESILAACQPEPLTTQFRIARYPARGGKAEPVATALWTARGKPAHSLGPAASRDGKSLFYARYDRGESEYNKKQLYQAPEVPLAQVVRRDRATGEEQEITHAPGGGFRPVLSPDGSLVAFGSRQGVRTGLRLLDLATGAERWLKVPIQRDDQEGALSCDLLPGFAFAPDGRSIVAAYGGKIHRIDLATGADPVIPFRAAVRLAASRRVDFPTRVEEGPVRARLIQGAAPSPDGKRLAFSALTRLYVLDLPAGKPAQLNAEGDREFLPAWSPDGKWLAYVARSAEGEHLWKRPVDGSGPPARLTTRAATYRDPAWSPDGAGIVALRGPHPGKGGNLKSTFDAPDRRELIWVAAAGGQERAILPPLVASRPHFGPEPDRAYLSTPNGLTSVRLDGGDFRRHASLYQPESAEGISGGSVASMVASPDGRWALAECAQQVYLVPLPGGPDGPPMDLDRVAKRLTVFGADEFGWAEGGRSIAWSLGSTYFRVPLDAARAGIGRPGEPLDAAARRDRPAAEEIPVVVERPRAISRGAVALRNAKDVTMRGDEVIDRGDVVVAGRRIAAIGPAGTVAIPAGAREVDLRGLVVVPGFVDTHAHWEQIGRQVLDLDNWNFAATLAYGVTTGRDPSTVVEAFAYQDLVEAGELVGPRAYSTGPAIYGPSTPRSHDEAVALATRYKKYYRTDYLKSYTLNGRRFRQWLLQACRDVGLMPTTEGFQSLNMQLTYLLDGFHGVEHALPVVGIEDDVVTLLARSGASYTGALQASYGGPQGINYFLATADSGPTPRRPASCRTSPSPVRPSACRGRGPRCTSSPGMPRRRPGRRGPAAASAWGAMARCRASATTGSCRRWPRAA